VLDVLTNMIVDLVGAVLGELLRRWPLIAFAVLGIVILLLWQVAFG
jgi:hypothetical protein